jgi:hypothetical protein
MVIRPRTIPFLYPIFESIKPAGMDNTKYAPKKAN